MGLPAQLQRIQQNRFLLIGRAGMDLYADPPGTRTQDAQQFFSCIGGSSANTAVALSRYGSHAALLTSVSDDSIGRFVLNQLQHYGIDTRYISLVGGEARTSLAVVETRIEDHQSVIYRNGAADFEMTRADVEQVAYADYGALIITGTALAAEPSRSAAFRAFELAQAAGLPIILDIDYRPYSWASAEAASHAYSRAAEYCDMIIGNDDEFGFMAGSKKKGLACARDLASAGTAIAIYKMGEHGSITLTPEREFKTGIYPVQALKPTGAGDAFMGGFMSSLVAGFSLEDSVLRGSAAAAIVVTKVGCAPAMPSSQELEHFLASHPGPSKTSGFA